jgi:hypothetical protein
MRFEDVYEMSGRISGNGLCDVFENTKGMTLKYRLIPLVTFAIFQSSLLGVGLAWVECEPREETF